jgi:hypothetical protein
MSEKGDKTVCGEHHTVSLESIELLEKLAPKGSDPKSENEMSISRELVRLTSASENQKL